MFLLHWNRRLLCETWLFTIVGYIWRTPVCSLMPSASSSTDVGGNGESGGESGLYLCWRPNRLHYGLCPSINLSVCLYVPYGLLTWEQSWCERSQDSSNRCAISVSSKVQIKVTGYQKITDISCVPHDMVFTCIWQAPAAWPTTH